MLVEFLVQRLAAYGFQIQLDDLEKLLEAGSCCLLFDGLDEVPTDQGRAAVSRLLEDCVQRFAKGRRGSRGGGGGRREGMGSEGCK